MVEGGGVLFGVVRLSVPLAECSGRSRDGGGLASSLLLRKAPLRAHGAGDVNRPFSVPVFPVLRHGGCSVERSRAGRRLLQIDLAGCTPLCSPSWSSGPRVVWAAVPGFAGVISGNADRGG